MTIDANELQRLSDAWAEVNLDEMMYVHHNRYALLDISKNLGEMGLDMNADASYELLVPGLGKAQFDEALLVATIREVNAVYGTAITNIDRNGYIDQHANTQVHALTRLVKTLLPALKSLAQDSSGNFLINHVPGNLSTMEMRQIDVILDMDKDGTLQNALQRAAVRAAESQFRTACSYMEDAKRNPIEPNADVRSLRQGLGYVDSALDMIAKAGPLFTPRDVYLKFGNRGGVPRKDGSSAELSVAVLEAMRDFFLIREAGVEFACAYEFHKRGQYVLDASGSGHGAMVMPMQKILTTLQGRGKDIRDPQLYADMGTDIDTFWAAYSAERAAVMQDQQYKNLVKPAFKR